MKRCRTFGSSLIQNAGWLEMSDHFCLLGKKRRNRALGRVYDIVPLAYGKLAVDLQVEFNKGAVTSVAEGVP